LSHVAYKFKSCILILTTGVFTAIHCCKLSQIPVESQVLSKDKKMRGSYDATSKQEKKEFGGFGPSETSAHVMVLA
jgi:hypothetical protein